MKNKVNRAAKAKTTDKDLRFLSSCENEDLRVLCDILTHDRLGNIRITEQLTSTDGRYVIPRSADQQRIAEIWF